MIKNTVSTSTISFKELFENHDIRNNRNTINWFPPPKLLPVLATLKYKLVETMTIL